MALYVGSATTSAFYVGAKTVSAIYLGSTQVWPSAAPSGPALVNHYSATTTTASNANSVPGVTAAVGDVIVAACSTAIATTAKYITSVTDPAGNTWTMRQHIIGAAGTANSGAEIWTATVTAALSNATLTFNSSGGQSLGTYNVVVLSGVTETGIVGTTAAAAGAQANSPACNVTTTGPAAVVGCYTRGKDTVPDSGPGAGFTNLAAGSSSGASTTSDYGGAAYAIESAAGTYGPSWGMSTDPARWALATVGLPSA